MGQRDFVTNRCLSDDARYADLLNGILFGGEQKLCKDSLQELDSRSIIDRWKDKFGYGKTQIFRDVVKKAAFGMNFAVIGIENQNEVHYLMPLRAMSYDVAEYEKQASNIRKTVRTRKGRSNAEFLSGFGKTDKLHPCITIVLFYGENWDGGKDLHELLDFTDIPEDLKPYINNYRIHIVNMAKWENTEVFKTDLRQIFNFLKCANDRNKLGKLMEKDPAYQELDEDAYDMMAEFANSKELKNIKKKYQKGRTIDMCKGLRDWMEEERLVGMEQGIERGIEQGISIFIKDKVEDGVQKQEIVSKLVLRFKINEKKAEEYYLKYK